MDGQEDLHNPLHWIYIRTSANVRRTTNLCDDPLDVVHKVDVPLCRFMLVSGNAALNMQVGLGLAK